MTRNLLAEATRLPYTTLERYIHILDLLYSSLTLDFDMQAQTQSNWCWAATSVSVSRFYWPLSGWDQCEVANNELGLSGCCGSPVPSACNVPWFLDRALTRTSNFVSITGVAAVHGAVVNPGEHDDGGGRGEGEGDRQKQGQGAARPQAGQYADERSHEASQKTEEEVLGLEGNPEAIE